MQVRCGEKGVWDLSQGEKWLPNKEKNFSSLQGSAVVVQGRGVKKIGKKKKRRY